MIFSPLQSFALSDSLIVRCKHGPPHLFDQLKKFGNPHEGRWKSCRNRGGRFHSDLYFSKPCDETDKQIRFSPTWIQSKKKHVEQDSTQKDSTQSERARAGQLKFSVQEPEHGFEFGDHSSCRTQTQSEGLENLSHDLIKHTL